MNTCLFLASDSPISKLNNVPWLFSYNGIVEFLSRLYYSVLVVLNDPVKLKEKTPHTIGTVWKNKQEEFYKALGSLHGHVFSFFFFFQLSSAYAESREDVTTWLVLLVTITKCVYAWNCTSFHQVFLAPYRLDHTVTLIFPEMKCHHLLLCIVLTVSTVFVFCSMVHQVVNVQRKK